MSCWANFFKYEAKLAIRADGGDGFVNCPAINGSHSRDTDRRNFDLVEEDLLALDAQAILNKDSCNFESFRVIIKMYSYVAPHGLQP
jgi:hypothetical protein